eukprot:TRINITY_DN112699_c0_g1_i1.p2 TRINITY_DN112699_c0_g1~~TRINITY_DN112699_c0_g1_i1.p2  ORF type:complete len:234 (-),score=34.23 TRINITY_DN112699_c0_g1_i1:185-886(-)
MGNATTACCSTGHDRCCGGSDVEREGKAGAPVGAAPLPSSEVMGIDVSETPGLDNKIDIGKDRAKAGFFAEGDGFNANGEKQEYQYVTYEDGSTYIGQIINGKRQGHGIWQSRTGQYEGQWEADSQHGRGRQTWHDGRVYDGQFQKGRFSGHGRMVWHTQKGMLIYEGQYQEDLKHGEGKFVWADGRMYDGQWRHGARHGRGLYMNTRCERRIGYWVEDKFERWEKDDAAAPA